MWCKHLETCPQCGVPPPVLTIRPAGSAPPGFAALGTRYTSTWPFTFSRWSPVLLTALRQRLCACTHSCPPQSHGSHVAGATSSVAAHARTCGAAKDSPPCRPAGCAWPHAQVARGAAAAATPQTPTQSFGAKCEVLGSVFRDEACRQTTTELHTGHWNGDLPGPSSRHAAAAPGTGCGWSAPVWRAATARSPPAERGCPLCALPPPPEQAQHRSGSCAAAATRATLPQCMHLCAALHSWYA